MSVIILGLYIFFMGFIFLYSLIQGHLVLLYFVKKKKSIATSFSKSYFPKVAIQLPIYNEKYVAERLIDKIIELEYPIDLLEIQVLDDSNDETKNIIAQKVAEVKNKGFNITHYTRPKNIGFKAGALAEGMEELEAELIAIFDADFMPEKDFLKNTTPYFQDEKIGVVQTRWAHLNEDYSLLTKLQAFGLDAHFTIEQTAKNLGGHFINFNGTAGVWRKECIIDAGGWESDTITEDLDLSYRAQMKGWKFKYLEEVGCPAELPVAMNALKNQQFRWTKGAAETAKKNLWNFLKTPKLGFSTKVHGFFHLLNSFLFVCIFSTAVLSVPILYIKQDLIGYEWLFNLAAILVGSFLILGLYYYTTQKRRHSKNKFFLRFPLFLSVSMGLSLHNAIAVLEGYLGIKSPFVRTPKFAITENTGSWAEKKEYLKSTFNSLTILEILMGCYALFGIYSAFKLNDFGLLPFHCMLALGFIYVAYYSYKHSKPA